MLFLHDIQHLEKTNRNYSNRYSIDTFRNPLSSSDQCFSQKTFRNLSSSSPVLKRRSSSKSLQNVLMAIVNVFPPTNVYTQPEIFLGGRNPANHLRCMKPVVNNGINYQPQLVSRISSINSISRGALVDWP